jgi:predicted metal-binding membrane protein
VSPVGSRPAPHAPQSLYIEGLPWVLWGLALAALLAVVLWGASPYSRYLHHEHQPDSAAGQAAALALFLVGWTLMMVAMMLPSASRLLAAFAQLTRQRTARAWLLALVVVGFLGAWLVVGYVFRAVDTGVHAVVDAIEPLQRRPHLLGAAALFVAGAYQFSSVKYSCLRACRAPPSFLYRYWHGERPAREALNIGVAYGRSCIGCCWALMLVMFALGSASVAWMLGVGLVMSIEKGTAVGRHTTIPLGVVLIGAAAWVAA